MKVLICIVLSLIMLDGKTQDIQKEILEVIDKSVPQNILIYRIKTRPILEGQLERDLFAKSNADFYDPFYILPQNGYGLDYSVKRFGLKYPQEKWWLFQICWPNSYVKDSTHLISTGSFQYSVMDMYYLVAISSKLEIKFISGDFYRSLISKDFDLKIDEPESFIYYLQLKTFNYETRDIKFYKKKDNLYIYKAYSDGLQREIEIYLDLKDIEEFTVKYEKMSYWENFGKNVPFK